MGQPFVISAKFNADASGLSAATKASSQDIRGLGADLDNASGRAFALTQSFDKQASSIGRAVEQTERLRALSINDNLRIKDDFGGTKRAADIEAYGKQLDNLRAKYNPVFAAQQQYETSQADIHRAHSLGAIDANELAAALMREEVAFERAVGAIDANSAALKRNASAAKATGHNFNVGNLAAQGQDVAVTAFMGMDPKMIALQQGTQAASVFAGMGVKEAAATAGGAIASLFSPVSLLTIGLVGLGAAGIQAFMHIASSQDDAVKTLDDYRKNLSGILAGWGDAEAAAKKALDEAAKLPQGVVQSNLETKLDAGGTALDVLDQRIKSVRERIAELNADLSSTSAPAMFGVDKGPALDAVRAQAAALRDLTFSARSTVPELDAAMTASNSLFNSADDPSIKGMAKDVYDLAAASRDANYANQATATSLNHVSVSPAQIASLRDLTAALREMSQVAVPNVSELQQVENAYQRAMLNAHTLQEVEQREQDHNEAMARLRAKGVGANFPAMDPAINDNAAIQVYDETRTAAEKYGSELSRLKLLLSSSAIDQDTYTRAVAKAKREMDQANKREANLDGSTAASKAAAKDLTDFGKITLGSQQATAQILLFSRSLGISREQADEMRISQDLLAKAQTAGIDVTADQRQELMDLAKSQAAATEGARRLEEEYNFGKQTFGAFFADFKSELVSGAGLWDSFATAGANALDKIADKALGMAADGIFDLIFGSLTSAIGGGGTNGIGSGPGTFSNFTKFFGIGQNAKGTSNWRGGLTWVGEEGPELVDLPSGSGVYSNQRSMAMAAGVQAGMAANSNSTSMTFTTTIDARGSGISEAQLSQLLDTRDQRLAHAVPLLMADANRRAKRGT